MPKKCQQWFCAAFKASTSVDCGPNWFKRIALARFFAPLKDENIVLGVGPQKNAENALKCLKSDKNGFVQHLRPLPRLIVDRFGSNELR